MGLSLGRVRETQRLLWGVAVSFYGVGDVVTTVAGFRVQSAAEAGPVALFVLGSSGVVGFLVVKGLFIGACFGLWKILETPGRVAIPLALAVAGLLVTTWNVTVLVG